jgi:3-methyl-2-oxobutanoate hydroxymethyltransferase
VGRLVASLSEVGEGLPDQVREAFFMARIGAASVARSPRKASTTSTPDGRGKVTVPDVLRTKAAGGRLTMLTAYDATFAGIFDAAGVDILLVGDSVGMVVQGLESTIPVTLEEVIYHTRCVARARPRALVVGDLPFLSYQVSPHDAVANAGRLLKEGGAEAVKLEGGVPMARTIEALAAVDIPVMAHIGLTPQSVHRMGGFKVQGRSRGHRAGDRERLLDDARAVEVAGAFAVVLEGIPRDLAEEITAMLGIPTIGIGAGPGCDGQVLVMHDLLGLSPRSPKFARRFADLRTETMHAVRSYVEQVTRGAFPSEAECYHSLVPVEEPARSGARG